MERVATDTHGTGGGDFLCRAGGPPSSSLLFLSLFLSCGFFFPFFFKESSSHTQKFFFSSSSSHDVFFCLKIMCLFFTRGEDDTFPKTWGGVLLLLSPLSDVNTANDDDDSNKNARAREKEEWTKADSKDDREKNWLWTTKRT